MNIPFWRYGFWILFGLVLLFRGWQAEEDLNGQKNLFPNPQKGTFRAWITEEPEVLFEHLPGSHSTGRFNGTYQPFVREVRTVCELISWDGKIVPPVKTRVTFRLLPDPLQPILNYGDTVELEGKILAPPPAMNPGQFDYAHYLKTKGVAYVMYVSPNKWKKMGVGANLVFAQGDGEHRPYIHQYGSMFIRWSCAMKRRAEEAIYGFLAFPENALLDGLLLGERGPLPSGMVEAFMVTGTVHILAVSGMMTAFIAGLLFLVLRAFQAPRKWAAGLALVGVIFFIFMTGAHPPVCRAGLFSILALTAVLFERKIHGGRLLLSTALILIVVNPFVIQDLSFQISFLATAGLMVFSSGLLKKLSFLWKPSAMLVTSTVAAQVSVWCLLIYFFNQLSLYSPFANLLIVPLALFATAAGLTAIAGSFIHPLLGTVFGAACGVPLKLLILLAEKIALLPGAKLTVASPPGFWVLAFHFLFLLSLFLLWPRIKPEAPSDSWKIKDAVYSRWKKRIGMVWWVFFLFSTFWFIYSTLQPKPLRVIFLSVGHGNAVVVRSPKGQILVVDGGKQTRGSDRYNPVVSYLRHMGIQKVEGILETHPDADHAGGLINVLSAYPVSVAMESSKTQADSRVYHDFKTLIQKQNVKLVQVKEGDQTGILEPAHLKILHPSEGYSPGIHPDNNLSVVSLLSYGGHSMVLPGDLEKEGLLHLLKIYQPFPKVDWLMAPHHGRQTGEPGLCAKGLQPRFVVFSDWKDYPEARARYLEEDPAVEILSTSQEGAIEVEMNGNGTGRYRSFRGGDWKPF